MACVKQSELVTVFAGTVAAAGWAAERCEAEYGVKLATHNKGLGLPACYVEMQAPGAYFGLRAAQFGGEVSYSLSVPNEAALDLKAEPPQLLPDEPPALRMVRESIHAVASAAPQLSAERPAWQLRDQRLSSYAGGTMLVESKSLVPILAQLLQILGEATVASVQEDRRTQAHLLAKLTAKKATEPIF
ncbi:MAG TPA: hypothetical protein VJ836_05340 [Candidatus Saccharimonadales bacterium]|nr:hypothetical protein [Candidatus Saccharimonadales bacterium]